MGGGIEELLSTLRNSLSSKDRRLDSKTRMSAQTCTSSGGSVLPTWRWRTKMLDTLLRFWRDDEGQDIAEYAVMLAVILVIVVGTIRLIGTNANNVFSTVASSVQ